MKTRKMVRIYEDSRYDRNSIEWQSSHDNINNCFLLFDSNDHEISQIWISDKELVKLNIEITKHLMMRYVK
jgi:hypothetical protein